MRRTSDGHGSEKLEIGFVDAQAGDEVLLSILVCFGLLVIGVFVFVFSFAIILV